MIVLVAVLALIGIGALAGSIACLSRQRELSLHAERERDMETEVGHAF